MYLPNNFLKGRRLETLVENQTTYSLSNAEMHVFETHQEAERVLLQFHHAVLASMLIGKKVMHLRDSEAFEFLPGESLILPKDEVMCIDFPEAKLNNPTKCLAMTISEEKIKKTIDLINENAPRSEGEEWRFTDYNFHFTNDLAIHQIINRLLFLFTENHPSKDLFVDMNLQELIVRLIQTENRKIYDKEAINLSSSNRLAFVIRYIREHLDEELSIDELSDKAYMSESNFYRVFKNELGLSPIAFINNERLKKAASLLKDPNRQIKEVYLECGFNSLSYFNRVFKRVYHMSPSAYQKQSATHLN
jgi:AraC family transcriptional regulator